MISNKQLNKCFTAVLFDLDGTLIDSEPLQFKANRILFKQYGKHYSRKEQAEFLGVRTADELRLLKQRWRLKVNLKKLITQRKKIILGLLGTDLKLMPGVVKTLKNLQAAKYLLGLGTSGEVWYVKRVLQQFKLKKYFQAVVTGNDVTKSKPDPETYLQLSSRLKTAPQKCLVVEDAPAGIAAAKAADMSYWVVRNKRINAEFYLDNGKKILDFSSQTLNLSLGHSHPELISAAKKQMGLF